MTWYTCFPRPERECREPKSKLYHVAFSTWYKCFPRSEKVYIPPCTTCTRKSRLDTRAGGADWRAGAGAAWIAPERVPHVNGQKSVVLVVHRRETLVDQAKRRTTSALPTWYTMRERASWYRCLPRSDAVFRAVPRLVVQLAVRCAPLATKPRRTSTPSRHAAPRRRGRASVGPESRMEHPRRPEAHGRPLTRPPGASQNSVRVVHP